MSRRLPLARIKFVTSTELVHPQVLGDNLKLTRIAMNLLGNVKKFTPAGGTIQNPEIALRERAVFEIKRNFAKKDKDEL